MRSPVLACLLLSFACGGPSAPTRAAPAAPAPAASDAGAPADAAAADDDAVAPSVPAELRETIARVERTGHMLALLDQPAAFATDIAVERGARTDVIGYLVVPRTKRFALEVNFYVHENPLTIGYRVVFPLRPGAQPTGDKLDPPQPATAREETWFRARQLVLSKLDHPAQHYDPVVMPARIAGQEGLLVYLLASPTRPDTVVFGQHFRARTSADGARVLEFEPLSKSALEMPLHPALPPGAKPVGLTVTQIVTDYPVETHVFESLVHHVPIYVGTSRGVWKVDGYRIAFLGAGPG